MVSIMNINFGKKRKEKITLVFSYEHDCEPVSLILITGFRDAVCGFMPPLGGGLWWSIKNPF
jgi:hypothetical protein